MTFPCRVFFGLSRLGIFDLQTPGARQSAPAPVKTVGPLARKAVGVEGHDEGCQVSYPSPRPPPGGGRAGDAPLEAELRRLGEGVGPVERSLLAEFPALIWASEASSGSPGALPELFPSA